MSPSFDAHLGVVHDYTMAILADAVACLVTHGAAEYAKSWRLDTVEDYLHLLATDDAIHAAGEKLSGDSAMQYIAEDVLRGIVRLMAHVAELQEAPRAHD